MKKEAAAVVPQASKLIRVKVRVSGKSSGRAQLLELFRVRVGARPVGVGLGVVLASRSD